MRLRSLPLTAAGLVGLLFACQSLIGLPDREHQPAANGGRGGSAGRGGAGGNNASKAAACTAFCKRAVDICTEEYAIYHGPGDCEPACQLLSLSEIMCRDAELTKAFSSREPWDHCQAATLGGSDACGGNCENYCKYTGQVCTGDNRDMAEAMLSEEQCVDKCKQLVDHEFQSGLPSNATRYNVDDDHEGDSLQCRLVHLTIAAANAAKDHCWHAALAPRPEARTGDTNPCSTGENETVPHCSDFCHIVMNACSESDNKVYESPEQCEAVCGKLNLGNVSDASGDSVGCRKTHAYNALIIDADRHCPHAGPGGAAVCGTDCPAYCTLFKAGCKTAFEMAHGTGADANDKCLSECTTAHGVDAVNYSVASAAARDSNAIACRLLNVARALEKPGEAAKFCASASGQADCKR
jgi:hypothetical protein